MIRKLPLLNFYNFSKIGNIYDKTYLDKLINFSADSAQERIWGYFDTFGTPFVTNLMRQNFINFRHLPRLVIAFLIPKSEKIHTSEFDKSPNTSHKSCTVVTPANKITNKPTHLTLKKEQKFIVFQYKHNN